jgi:tRNA-uridine 2-sulfurtransferase
MKAAALPIRHEARASQEARRRVVVAMSGGVDSAVAAALMQREGHEVIGITLQLYDHGAATRRSGACCAGQDIHDARRAAEHLGIPHYVLDYEARFKTAVIDTFADSYVRGETPIPCIACNQEVKFRDLLETAQELGADLLATGHYIERRDEAGAAVLCRPADTARDQSYFLFATTPAQLARLAFPLGNLTKPQVRALAVEIGLPVASKPDSQDICFVASGGYADIVQRLRPEAATPGDIVHLDGRVLGRHEGIAQFTVGQRKGLKVPAAEPLYVVKVEPSTARVVVGPREALAVDVLSLRDVNWLGDGDLGQLIAGDGLEVHVRIRSAQAPRPAVLVADAVTGGVGVVLPGGEFGVARGQACVFYSDGGERARVLGGGFIADTARRPAANVV